MPGKKRRGRGEGHVFKTKEGRWRARYSYYDAQGQRHKPSGTFDTKEEALDWYARQRGTAHGGTDTFGQWFTAWLELQKSARAHQTWDRDRQVIETHLRPAWARVKVKDLTLLDVRRWLAKLETNGVSASERDRCATTLRKIVNSAVDNAIIPASPLTRLRLPTVHRDEKRVLTAEQLGHLAWVAAEEKHPQCRAMVLVQADACLRAGELLGLTRGDFDPAAGALKIRQSVEKRTGKIKPLKTKFSRRTLPLSPRTVTAILETLRSDEPGEPLFPEKYREGFLTYGNWFQNIFKPLRKAAGLEWMLPTTLRHTGASLLLSAGVNVLVVSRRCGHASPTITLSTYAHLLPDDQAKAAAVFEAILRPKLAPPKEKP